MKYIYQQKSKYLKDKKVVKYLNKLGAKGFDVFSVYARGAYIKGKREYTFLIKKCIE